MTKMKTKDVKTNGNIRAKAEADQALIESVKTFGIIQPLVLTKDSVLIAGHRRLDAAKKAGLAEVPVVIASFESKDTRALQFAENVHRKDLTPLEKVALVKEYIGVVEHPKDALPDIGTKDLKAKVASIAGLLSLSEKVTWMLYRVSLLPQKVLKWLEDEVIGFEHARLFLDLTFEQQEKVAEGIAYQVPAKGQGSIPVTTVSNFIDKAYGRELKAAIFPTKEPYADKQACSACPHNSANLDALFTGGGIGTCRLASCFLSKTNRVWSERKATFMKKAPWVFLKFTGYASIQRTWDGNQVPTTIKGMKVLGKPTKAQMEEIEKEAEKPIKDRVQKYSWALLKDGDGVPLLLTEKSAKDKKTEEGPTYDPKKNYINRYKTNKLRQAVHQALHKVKDSAILAFCLAEDKEDLEQDKLPLTVQGILRLRVLSTYMSNAIVKLSGVDSKKIEAEAEKEGEKAWAEEEAKKAKPASRRANAGDESGTEG